MKASGTSASRGVRPAALRCLALILLISWLQPALCAATPPVPKVAIHVSELTRALETMPATSPTPTGPGTSGFQWWNTSWHYFVMHESLKEALRSDGTPFIEVSDADIAAGALLNSDGSPAYPILISLASEAIGDNEVQRLRDFVVAGGFLFVGSSAFTRKPDGTSRGDFALATEMGLHAANTALTNWYENRLFTKVIDNRLTSHVPTGTNSWAMPDDSEQIPLGTYPDYGPHTDHPAWKVTAAGADVLATGTSGPLLAMKAYGAGRFIYFGPMQPLIGHGGFDNGMYSYVIFRRAIEWAFESATLPIVRLSPWPYANDAAFVVRHDLENWGSVIRNSIAASAKYEYDRGAKGDYYFTTGTLRAGSEDTQLSPDAKLAAISQVQSAVKNYSASIGPHNGGLRNPATAWIPPTEYEYWHWGPDEALDTTQPGYASGKAYAQTSLTIAFADVEGWLAGLDNGRPGCGATGTCPRLWVAPAFNSTREASYDILQQLGVRTAGEQKIGPLPHWAVSTQTPGKLYPTVTLPTSEWYVGEIAQSLESHTTSSVDRAVDFYYSLGALINIYGHGTSDQSALTQHYITYNLSKPRNWATNATGVYDWWVARSAAAVTPGYSVAGTSASATAAVTGATNTEAAVELVLPNWSTGGVSDLQVWLNGSQAPSTEYRTTSYGVKVRVGTAASNVEVRYTVAQSPPNCAYAIAPTAQTFGPSAGNGSVAVTAPAGCTWTAASNASWMTITSSSTGTASGTVTYSVEALPGTTTRTGTLTVAGQTVTVTQAANQSPTVALTSPANGATFAAGATITLAATASDTDGTITQVAFYQGSTLLGTDATNPYSYSWVNVPTGTYTLAAVANDNSGATTTSAPVSVTVSGSSGTCTFPSTGILDNFNRANGAIGSAWTGSVGGYAIASNQLDVGTGDAIYWNATFGADQEAYVTLRTIDQTAAEIDLLLKVQSAGWGGGTIEVFYDVANRRAQVWTYASGQGWVQRGADIPVTFQAGDVFGATARADGTVAVYRNGVLLGSRSVSGWTFAAGGGRVGLWMISAPAVVLDDLGGGNYVCSARNQPPTVTLTSPTNGATFTAGATIALAATAADGDGTVAQVAFYQGTTLLGTDTTSPYEVSWANVPAGSYTLTAVATDDKGTTTTSAPVAITVTGTNQPPTVTLTSPANGAMFTAGATIALAATAADSDGTVAQVAFYQGTTLLGTDTTSPYGMSWVNVATGSYTLTAVATDDKGATTTSAPVAVTVTVAASAVTVSPTSLTFATRLIGTTSGAGRVTLTNRGTGPLTITGITIGGTNATDFGRTTTCGTSLAAATSCTTSVTFRPTAAYARTATLSINDSDPSSPQTVSLSGTGTAVSVSPTSLSFSRQTVGTTSAAKTITVRNAGSTPLTVSGIVITGTYPGDFAQTNTCGASVAAGASCSISVTFRPTAIGTRTATVSISDVDPASPQRVTLTGSGR